MLLLPALGLPVNTKYFSDIADYYVKGLELHTIIFSLWHALKEATFFFSVYFLGSLAHRIYLSVLDLQLSLALSCSSA